MIHFASLVAQWECAEDTAFHAECRIEQAVDEYCSAQGPAPDPADVARTRRLRFVAGHRLRWLLYQVRKAQAGTRLI